MQWTSQQDAALRAVSQWLRERSSPVFRLFGYAGTGKTTLAKHLATDRNVAFAAYTGKAALVMRKNGCRDASTIHSLIYQPYKAEDAEDRLRFVEHRLATDENLSAEDRKRLEAERGELIASLRSPNRPKPSFILRSDPQGLQDVSLIVIDECSMVNEEMARDLMSFDIPILVLGDPAQLPPVKGTGWFTSEKPDIMLTDVQRQARDNPIIHLATTVREGGRLTLGDYGTSKVISGKYPFEFAQEHSQIIVGMNRTRKATNQWYRRQLGLQAPIPVEGDRLICLRNDKKEGLLNGSMWTAQADADADHTRNQILLHDIKSDDDGRVLKGLTAHAHILLGEERQLLPSEWMLNQEFDYAYAITCHKSQGSQWESVLLSDESHSFRENARNWLYTGITRAQERITIKLN